MVMIDIDHFKSINDQYGHQAGDEALKQFAEILKQNTRFIDRVGRYGGEEFAIILPQIFNTEAFEMAERLRSIVSAYPFTIFKEKKHPLEIHMTISLGIASLPEDADTLDLLVNKTDKALYEAKDRGRNCVVQYRDIRSLKVS